MFDISMLSMCGKCMVSVLVQPYSTTMHGNFIQVIPLIYLTRSREQQPHGPNII